MILSYVVSIASSSCTSFAADAYIVASEAAWIDITNQGVHKGTTVAQLQNLLAVSPSRNDGLWGWIE